ncbi:hypothetical protein MTO96_002405 [Rhipicephalus appendiculatus]
MCSLILQMQIIQHLCKGANHTGRLNECDIFGSKEAGRRLTSTLKLGSSKPFAYVMKMINEGRQETVDAAATLEYFLPSLEWLEGSSERYFGWGIARAASRFDSPGCGSARRRHRSHQLGGVVDALEGAPGLSRPPLLLLPLWASGRIRGQRRMRPASTRRPHSSLASDSASWEPPPPHHWCPAPPAHTVSHSE